MVFFKSGENGWPDQVDNDFEGPQSSCGGSYVVKKGGFGVTERT